MADYNNKSKKNKSKKEDNQDNSLDNTLDNLIQWGTQRTSHTTTLPSSYTSKSSNFKWDMKIDQFAMRGLNKYKNILTAPDCDCGCGGKGRPVFENREDLLDFCGYVLFEAECEHCAIFLVHQNGKQEVIIKDWEWDDETGEPEEYIESVHTKSNDVDSFAIIDAEYCFHRYGLLIEHEDNSWEICE